VVVIDPFALNQCLLKEGGGDHHRHLDDGEDHRKKAKVLRAQVSGKDD
jgi:hypothetical protein